MNCVNECDEMNIRMIVLESSTTYLCLFSCDTCTVSSPPKLNEKYDAIRTFEAGL